MIDKEEIPKSPAWHETILNDREKALCAGKITTSDWEEAQKKIKKNTAGKRIKGV
jgi:hypothetical protein